MMRLIKKRECHAVIPIELLFFLSHKPLHYLIIFNFRESPKLIYSQLSNIEASVV